ncbi:hypothetical protein ACSVDA_03725 [Cytobacillus sp. Hm23]
MSDEGIWDLSWSWESYEEQFETARNYWKGILVVDRYNKLKKFGLLE